MTDRSEKPMSNVGWVEVDEYEPNGSPGDLCIVANDTEGGDKQRIAIASYQGQPGKWAITDGLDAMEVEEIDWIMIIPPINNATYYFSLRPLTTPKTDNDISLRVDWGTAWGLAFVSAGCLVPLLLCSGTLIIISYIIWGG